MPATDGSGEGSGSRGSPNAAPWSPNAAPGVEVLISAIEHYSYCPRQCALIHLDREYEHNLYTTRGKLLHERVHGDGDESVRGVTIVRGMPLYCERLALRGKADLIELRAEGLYPVEYKSGPSRGGHVELQLCAQALCLEEMMGVPVPRGAVFSFARQRRREVLLSERLRQRTEEAIAAIRELLCGSSPSATSVRLPPPVNDKRCPTCSLVDICLPDVVADRDRLRGLQKALFEPWDVAAGDELE